MSSFPKEHIIPKIEDWPISKFAANRAEFIDKLLNYSYTKINESAKDGIQEIISKTIYLERNRSKNNKWKVDPADEEQYWNGLNLEYQKALAASDSEEQLQLLLKRIINRYSEEIVGGFNPKTFRFTRKMTTTFFKAIMNKFIEAGKRPFWGSKKNLYGQFKVYGDLEEMRSLFDKGTVVMVPNHISNIDSLVIGYIIDQIVKVPAFLYGAGLNLYDVELVAYYFNRLGTYRVDRRKKNPIYLTVLKSMASLSIVEGVNNIFFPGGTRSRSGKIEKKLKLGLLNSVIEAQQYNLENSNSEKIFIVPMVMSYPFVLEAKPLVNQYLRKIGAEKYRYTREKVGKFNFIRHLIWTIFKKKTEIHVSFGKPRDVLGNYVNSKGVSLDSKNQEIDITDYFMSIKGLNKDEQRESIYTRILADKIVDDYKRINPILSTDVVSYLVFKRLIKTYPNLDLFRLLNIPAKNFSISREEILIDLKEIVRELKTKEKDNVLSLSTIFSNENLENILDHAIKNIGIYHTKKSLYQKNKIIKSEDLKLLYYYHNKLDGYNLD